MLTETVMDISQAEEIIALALKEDIGSGDLTTNLLLADEAKRDAFVLVKSEGIVAGLPLVEMIFRKLDPAMTFVAKAKDGDRIKAGTVVMEIRGSYRALLSGERTVLNFLQRLSGIATRTAEFAAAVKATKAQILDTRKTAPGMRLLDKYAVRIGGGTNHRIGLFDMVLIKDNHIRVAGSVTAAVAQIRAGASEGMKIEVEVRSLTETQEAAKLNVDMIMLDNMTVDEMKQAVGMIGNQAKVEASGGVNLESVRRIAETGVDYISIGQLTHSVQALDVSLKIRE